MYDSIAFSDLIDKIRVKNSRPSVSKAAVYL